MLSTLAYGAGTFFPRLASLLAIFIFSRWLPVPDFGLYVLTIAVGEFCDWVSSAWFRIAFLRFYHSGKIAAAEGGKLDLTPLLGFSVILVLAGSALAFPIAWVLARDHWLAFGIGTALYTLSAGFTQTALTVIRGEGRSALYAAVEVARPVLGLAGGIGAVQLLGGSYAHCVIGVFGSQTLSGILLFAALSLRRNRGQSTWPWLPDLLHFGWPIIISGALFAIINAADRTQLQWLLGPGSVGLYGAASSVGRQPLDVLFFAMNLGAFSELVKAYDTQGPAAGGQMLGRQMVLLLGLTLPAVVGLAFVARPLLHLFFDPRYAQAIDLVLPLALVSLVSGIRSYGIHQAFHMTRRTGLQVLTYVPSVVVSVGAGYILIRSNGVVGAAYAALVGNLFSLILSVAIVLRLMPIKVPWVDLGKIAVGVAVMSLALVLGRSWAAGGIEGLAATVVLGAGVYGLALIGLDGLGSRQLAVRGLGMVRKRLRPAV
jgi:O-antigen/teichoic acid export membrane protein